VRSRRGPATVTGRVRRTRIDSAIRSDRSHWEAPLSGKARRKTRKPGDLPRPRPHTTLEEGKAPMTSDVRSLSPWLAPAIAALTLILCAPTPTATAAATQATVRVEGATDTALEESALTTDTRTVPVGGCAGGSEAREVPGATALGILDQAAGQSGIGYDNASFGPGPTDLFVCRIGNDAGGPASFWLYKVNHVAPTIGAGGYQLQPGDRVLWYFTSDFLAKTLDLVGPARAAAAGGVAVRVTAYDGAGAAVPAGGATVTATAASGGATASSVTGADGEAQLRLASPGVYALKASRPGDVRSNRILVCVSETGSGDCGVPAAQLGASPAPARTVRDSRAPTARISSPRHGRRYRRGPRLLRGKAVDGESGLGEVKLALRRHVPGRSCRWWSGRRERFVGTHCRKKFFFSIGDATDWSYLLPGPLGRGRYVLDVKAFDRARNRNERFVAGADRVVFYVSRRRSTRRRARSTRRAQVVRVMVVGRERVLAGPRSVPSRGRLVRASGRRCLVPAATPLAALAEALARERVPYHLRDFGSCSRRHASGSSQLFVDRVGPDRNSGQDGWFYKVNHRAGTAGGADPSGLRGGTLRRGDAVLWFYCIFDVGARSCQPSLTTRVATTVVAAGRPLTVRVLGYPNEGRAQAVAGATVTLGSASAQTDASGRVALIPPAAGRLSLTATKPGTVPAFPAVVRVRPDRPR
jgi:hypothetical protein